MSSDAARKLRGLVTFGPRQSLTSFKASFHAFEDEGIVLDLAYFSTKFSSRPIASLWHDFRLLTKLVFCKYDFAILNSGAALYSRPRLFWALIKVAIIKGVPTFTLWRNSKGKFQIIRKDIGDRQYDRVKLALKSNGLHHLANSVQTGADAAAEFELSRVGCIYNCPNVPQKYSAATVPVDPPIVLNVASVNFRKNPQLFLEVASLVARQRPDVQFVWLGGEATAAIDARIHELGIGQVVQFLAFSDDPFAHMQRASVFLLTSSEEAFGLVLAEAMAAYRTVFCSEGTGASEVPGDTGVIYEAKDASKIAMEILKVISRPAAERVNFLARKRYEEHFSPEVYAVRFGSIIRSVVR